MSLKPLWSTAAGRALSLAILLVIVLLFLLPDREPTPPPSPEAPAHRAQPIEPSSGGDAAGSLSGCGIQVPADALEIVVGDMPEGD